MAIVDVVSYNGEAELWDIHYNVLKDYVDQFIVIEFDKTFSGKPKESSFPVEEYSCVKYRFLTETDYGKYREMAEQSPNTVGADHWKLEFMQKESIKDALTHLKDDDIVFIGDVDEIWNPDILKIHESHCESVLKHKLDKCFKLKLLVYTYWLNNRSTEEFFGTIVAPYRVIKDNVLNHLRSQDSMQVLMDGRCGWHFTSMGGPKKLRAKLTDSYTQESYATPTVLGNLEYNMASNKDFLGRDFTYTIDESEWPEFLRGNRDKYKHLIK